MLIAISLEFWRQKKSRKTFILRDLVFLFCGETGTINIISYYFVILCILLIFNTIIAYLFHTIL
jgi:hypothetical protein